MAYYDINKIHQDINKEYNQIVKDMNQQISNMHKEAEEMLEQVEQIKKNLTWGVWEPYKIKFLPKRVKGKWYWPGDTVYRSQRFGPGGVHYKYGDDFDVIRDADRN